MYFKIKLVIFMNFISKIKVKFQNLLSFNKMNPINNFDFDEENIGEREFLFDNYVAQNIERFVVEFNSRMEKFNVYFLYNKIIGRILICLMN